MTKLQSIPSFNEHSTLHLLLLEDISSFESKLEKNSLQTNTYKESVETLMNSLVQKLQSSLNESMASLYAQLKLLESVWLVTVGPRRL